MATVSLEPSTWTAWTASDLVARFGPILLHRIINDPPPGSATVADVVRLDDHHDCICELIDGTLVRKSVGAYESYLAIKIASLVGSYVETNNLGVVLGEAGMMQLFPDQVRIPDVSFVSFENLQGSGFPNDPVPHLAPVLAVEVISASNTRQEMERKLTEYFDAGTQLVWYVYPEKKEVHAFKSAASTRIYSVQDELPGEDVLPGFAIKLAELFAVPEKKA
jgi:Uma2 family endonuclease